MVSLGRRLGREQRSLLHGHRRPRGRRLGNAYLYAYDQVSRTLRAVGDVLPAYRDHRPGDWGYGKIHGQISEDRCGRLYFHTCWGTRRGIAYGGSYTGDLLLRYDPAAQQLVSLGVPMPQMGAPSTQMWQAGDLLCGETNHPVGKENSRPEGKRFFAYDIARATTVFRSPEFSGLTSRSIGRAVPVTAAAVASCCATIRPPTPSKSWRPSGMTASCAPRAYSCNVDPAKPDDIYILANAGPLALGQVAGYLCEQRGTSHERSMKVAILAGGQGSRLLEETRVKSKAMVRIGQQPILWHIMKYYQTYGCAEFVIALGYQGDSIRDYFADLGSRRPIVIRGEQMICCPEAEPAWTVELIETGLDTMSGGRIKRLAPYLGNQRFMLTWCDGLSDVDLDKLRAFHAGHGRIGTLTAIHPPPRFGRLALSGDQIVAFREKAVDPSEWINGAFFVFDPEIFRYIEGDGTQFEHEPLARLAADGELMAYRHESFWQCMDTLKEVKTLNELWAGGAAPWRVWT